MSGTKKSRSKRDISPTHPDAAAIDIGATMHVAAVRPDRGRQREVPEVRPGYPRRPHRRARTW
jgi:hypothetical protein